MEWIEVFKAVLFGIIEGITEWLPISSTGHMILLDQLVSLKLSAEFKSMFLVVIQLGAIMAVVVLFWTKIWPFRRVATSGAGRAVAKELGNPQPTAGKIGFFGVYLDYDTVQLWLKILVGCLPAAVVGVLFSEKLDQWFYNYQTVSIMLILFGVLFILIENYNRSRTTQINQLRDITYRLALLIGVFQLIAAVFPGTSRSGATILGGILLGLSRSVAAEFTFFMAVPVMFGASLLKLFKLKIAMGFLEWVVLLVGMAVAYVVSYLAIRFLMRYIKRHDFKVFGWYRIALGIVVLFYFLIIH